MLTTIQAPDHVIALRFSSTITMEEVRQMEQIFAQKTAVYSDLGILIDVANWRDFTCEAIADDFTWEMGLINQLYRFPRIAIISDNKFVGSMVNIISPLLASVQAKMFSPLECGPALAFAADVSGARYVVNSRRQAVNRRSY